MIIPQQTLEAWHDTQVNNNDCPSTKFRSLAQQVFSQQTLEACTIHRLTIMIVPEQNLDAWHSE